MTTLRGHKMSENTESVGTAHLRVCYGWRQTVTLLYYIYLSYVSKSFWANYGVKSFLNSLSGHLLVSKTIAYNNNHDGNRGKENKKNLKIFKLSSLWRLQRLGQLGTFTEETLNLFTLFTCALQQPWLEFWPGCALVDLPVCSGRHRNSWQWHTFHLIQDISFFLHDFEGRWDCLGPLQSELVMYKTFYFKSLRTKVFAK